MGFAQGIGAVPARFSTCRNYLLGPIISIRKWYGVNFLDVFNSIQYAYGLWELSVPKSIETI